jgi:hypothetical protein
MKTIKGGKPFIGSKLLVHLYWCSGLQAFINPATVVVVN